MKTSLIITMSITLLLGAWSCTKDNSDGNTKFKWSGTNLSQAKYLAIGDGLSSKSVTKATENNSDIFMIDESGNMKAVIFYFDKITNENGEEVKTEVSSDVTVVPVEIVSLGGKYLYFHCCRFFESSGREINAETSGYYAGPSFLVDAGTGAVYLIPEDVPILSGGGAKLDSDGSIVYCNQYISRIGLENGELTYRQITTGAYDYGYSCLLTDVAGAYLANNCSFSEDEMPWSIDYNLGNKGMGVHIVYSNGGFAVLKPVGDSPDLLFQYPDNKPGLFVDDSSYEGNVSSYVYSLYDVNVGNSSTYSTEKRTSFLSNVSLSMKKAVIHDGKVIFVCTDVNGDVHFVTYSPTANDFNETVPPKFPTMTITEKGPNTMWSGQKYIAIDQNAHTISQFDFESMQYGETAYDLSSAGSFVQTGYIIEDSALTLYGVRNSDGTSIIVSVNIQTGAVSVKTVEDNRTVAQLIKLN